MRPFVEPRSNHYRTEQHSEDQPGVQGQPWALLHFSGVTAIVGDVYKSS